MSGGLKGRCENEVGGLRGVLLVTVYAFVVSIEPLSIVACCGCW